MAESFLNAPPHGERGGKGPLPWIQVSTPTGRPHVTRGCSLATRPWIESWEELDGKRRLRRALMVLPLPGQGSA